MAMFGTIKMPQVKTKLSGNIKSIFSDPVNIGAAVGVGVLGAGISYGIDHLLGYGVKVDNPIPFMSDIELVKQMYDGSPEKEFGRSMIAGVGGSAISFGIFALPLSQIAPKALIPAAIGAGLNVLAWTIIGAYKAANAPLAKTTVQVRTTEEAKKISEETYQKNIEAGKYGTPPFTGKLFSGRLASPGKEIYYVTDKDINVVVQKLHAVPQYKVAKSYMITDSTGKLVPGFSNDLNGILGTIGKVIAVDEQNRPTIIVKQSPGGYLLYKREGSRMVPAGLYMNEEAVNNAIDLLILRSNSEDGQRSGLAYTVKPHFVMQSAGMVYRRY